jgi:hypothetical protein
MQRVVGVPVVLLLASGLFTVLSHRHAELPQPLAVAAAVGPVEGAVDPAPAARLDAAGPVGRSNPSPRPRPHAAPLLAAHNAEWAVLAARIRGCESHGHPGAAPDYTAKNPNSSASGAYQIVDTTWAGRYGVDHASDATPEQQDGVALELYRRHGTADWAASASCWR